MKRGFPAYWLPILLGGGAAVFPDRITYWESILLALLLFLGSYGIGKRIAERFFPDADSWFFLPLGLGTWLITGYLCFLITTRLELLLVLWMCVSAFAVRERSLLQLRFTWSYLWALPFFFMACWSVYTPSVFFDAMVYHLGLPYQYIARQEMSLLPHHLYSTFPPLEQVLNLFFIGMHCDPGIKAFTLLLLLSIAGLIASTAGKLIQGLQPQPGVTAVLMLPSGWILLHLITADLLVSLFFCSGVALLITIRELSSRHVFLVSLFFAFSAWTKSNVLLFVGLLPLLWLMVRPRKEWKDLALFCVLFALLLTPLWIRNYVLLGDPLYPILGSKLGAPGWSALQDQVLKVDSFPRRVTGITGFFQTPLLLVLRPGSFGSASETGALWLVGLALYLCLRSSRTVNRMLLYILCCFSVWLFVFPNFRQFLPAFLLLFFAAAVSLNWLANRFPYVLTILWVLAGLHGLHLLRPFYQSYFPLISLQQTQAAYLGRHLEYYPLAEAVNRMSAPTLLLGETRSAHFRVPLVVCTAYDQNPFLGWAGQADDASSLRDRLRSEGLRYMIYNRAEMNRIVKKNPGWNPPEDKRPVLSEFLRKFTVQKGASDDVFLFEIKDR